MVYAQGGRQYVVIMAGGHHFMETPNGLRLPKYGLSAAYGLTAGR